MQVYAKKGQVSAKEHATKSTGIEHYKANRNEPCPPLGGGPEAFERKYYNEYRKEVLPEQGASEMGFGY